MLSAPFSPFAKESFIARASVRFVALLAQVTPVRERYVLTRDNRLRLRYMVAPALACVLAVTLGTSAVVQSFNTPYNIAALTSEDTVAELIGPVVEAQPVREAANMPPKPRNRVVQVSRGDTLSQVLQEDAGLSSVEAHNAAKVMTKFFDPRDIKIGQKIQMLFDPSSADAKPQYDFSSLKIDVSPLKTVKLKRADNEAGFDVSMEEKKAVKKTYARRAEIEVSLYGSGVKAGIPSGILADAIRIYSWDVDFQRDLRRGDALEVMYNQDETEDGKFLKSGNIIYARLNINGQSTPIYRYEAKNGDVDFFTADGKSIRKSLMSTPVDGARLSSGFGVRKHPVLGYTKMHKGVDFAAPRGTPIYAAGDGTIEKIGPFSSYGNYMRIRHNGDLKTAYAHMQRFASGLSVGSRVKQGQVIGYIGTTGRSTGPHLHFEVMERGVQVNPRSVKMQQGQSLAGKELASFKAHVKAVDSQYQSLLGEEQYASSAAGQSYLW